MSATDEHHERMGKGYPYTLRPELHKALKARGVDYWVAQGLTFWNCPDGRECVAYGYQSNGKPRLAVKIAGITDPEQAIEATLGRVECKVDVLNTGDCAGYECSEYIMHCNACGHEFGHVLYNEDGDVWMSEPPNFYPNCGRKVVDE